MCAAGSPHPPDTLGYNAAYQFMTPAEISMARILVAECKQEVSTFNALASRYEDFRVARGAAALDYHRTVREEVGGALSVFDLAEASNWRQPSWPAPLPRGAFWPPRVLIG